MRLLRPIIAFLSDFGLGDHYVGAVKGAILKVAREATIVDITHGVDPGDIEAGSRALAAAAPAFPDGTVFLAVVDPGVGGPRGIAIARRGTRTAIAPDNGLLTDWLALAPPSAVYRVSRVRQGTRASTFHGRDVFAPLAARLALGHAPSALGARRVRSVVALPRRRPQRMKTRIEGSVVRLDRFGDLVTDIPSAWLGARRPFRAQVGAAEIRHLASHYASIRKGEAAFVAGSDGTLEIAVNGGSAADLLGAKRGDRVIVRFLE